MATKPCAGKLTPIRGRLGSPATKQPDNLKIKLPGPTGVVIVLVPSWARRISATLPRAEPILVILTISVLPPLVPAGSKCSLVITVPTGMLSTAQVFMKLRCTVIDVDELIATMLATSVLPHCMIADPETIAALPRLVPSLLRCTVSMPPPPPETTVMASVTKPLIALVLPVWTMIKLPLVIVLAPVMFNAVWPAVKLAVVVVIVVTLAK